MSCRVFVLRDSVFHWHKRCLCNVRSWHVRDHLHPRATVRRYCVDDVSSIAARVFDPDAIMFFVK
jgi:hypothetical protein